MAVDQLMNWLCHPGEGRDPSFSRMMRGSMGPGLRRGDNLFFVAVQ
jgi:hypothetical protein